MSTATIGGRFRVSMASRARVNVRVRVTVKKPTFLRLNSESKLKDIINIEKT